MPKARSICSGSRQNSRPAAAATIAAAGNPKRQFGDDLRRAGAADRIGLYQKMLPPGIGVFRARRRQDTEGVFAAAYGLQHPARRGAAGEGAAGAEMIAT
jgi:hypothetical protein